MVDQLDAASPLSTSTSPVAAPAAAGRLRRPLTDTVALVVLFGAFYAVNDVRLWIGAPYWLDESWVALSTRVPLADLPLITSSTPLGWSLLLRIVPDPDALRLVPLVFAFLAVAAGYALGRLLPWRSKAESVLAGAICGAAVILLPAQQLRHDLKQYSADAAVTLATLAAVVWLERSWSRRRLLVIVVATPFAFAVSQVTFIVVAAAFAGLVVEAAVRRAWRRLAEAAVAGAISGALLVLMFLLLVEPNRSPALTDFWRDYYPSLADLPRYLHDRMRKLDPELGFHHSVAVLVLMVAGVLVLVALRRVAIVVAALVVAGAPLVLGVAKIYPLLDDRTSYFLFAAGAGVAGIAVAGAAVGVGRLVSRKRVRIGFAAEVTVALVALGAFAAANHAWYRFDGLDPRVPEYTPMAITDVRTQTRWIDAHRAAGDVVVINDNARFGYLFYHDREPMTWKATKGNTIGWQPVLRTDQNTILVGGGTLKSIEDSLNRAVAQAKRNGPNARILLLRTWWSSDKDAWRQALAPYEVSYAYSGTEPVAIIAHP